MVVPTGATIFCRNNRHGKYTKVSKQTTKPVIQGNQKYLRLALLELCRGHEAI